MMFLKPEGYPRGNFLRLVAIFTAILLVIGFVLPLLVRP